MQEPFGLVPTVTGEYPRPRLVGLMVVDASGQPLGSLAGTYVDSETGELLFGAVMMLRRGRRKLVIVSLLDARVDAESVSLTCGRELARRGPSVRPGEELPASEEAALFAHYDLPYVVTDARRRRLSPAETS